LSKEGYNCLEEEYSDIKVLDDINMKKFRITEEFNEAKDTYKRIEKMISETYF
jgi:hypothetical protein